ncbi:uncharacterized protein EAF01_002755 [Botrytis porri]|uniref:uncharacterized protein n=1 Tax=Botrytis porri TaxID=87229 RepID=UPI0019013E12|nr:uncharacterized protein EAF01_002755 [Botrytis porri]KAF7911248.1 hypothetical protein EAF01_002755 [Botrytis porri]
MAVPYPEGEVFFDRKVLAQRSKDGYRADNQKDFYSHFMIEYVWNVEAYHGSKNANSVAIGYQSVLGIQIPVLKPGVGHKHRRSGYKISKGDKWETHYGNWTQLPISYGPEQGDIKRRVEHNLCTSGNRFRNYEWGDSAEFFFMVLPMPTRAERWVWIDLLANIRAIYIPIAYSASEDYPDLSTWVQINFATDRTVPVWRAGGVTEEYKTDKLLGFGVKKDRTLGLDFTGLVELLTIPRQFRKVNPYSGKLVRIVPDNWVKTVPVNKSYRDADDISWLAIQKAHNGIDLMWKSVEKSFWIENFTKNAMVFAIGFIPGPGPFMAIAFSLTWTAIKDEEAFWDELSLWCPAVKLTDSFKEDMKKGFAEMREAFIDPRWLAPGTDVIVGKLNAKPKPVVEMTLDEAKKVQKETEVGKPPEGQKADDPDGGNVLGVAEAEE